jgi:hypothetical protein
MSDQFQKKLKIIDKNIKTLNSNTLNLKESLKLLKSTTNLLSAANNLIISQHNTINDESNVFLINNNLEKYYNELLIREKTIADLTKKYNLQKNNLQEEDITEEDIDNEKNTLLNKDNNNPIELAFIMDKNETLVKKGYKDLENIQDNMSSIKNDIYNQGKSINELGDTIYKNEQKAKTGESLIDEIILNQNCVKLLLTVLNFLLFVLILAIIIYKML